MQFFDLRKYQKILKDSYKELTRAIGLFSAGVGIGSFVYLRRILERLCEGSHQQCVKLPNWDEEKYKSSHFNERVEFLEQYGVQLLPSELAPVKSKLYSVMSKGIHEYSEKECLELFPCVQMAIELILDKRLEEIDRAAKIKEMMEKLRNNPPKALGNWKVLSFRDYDKDVIIDMATGEKKPTGLPKSNVLYFDLTDNSWCCARPSGTEPKIKFYMGVKGDNLEDAAAKVEELKENLKAIL